MQPMVVLFARPIFGEQWSPNYLKGVHLIGDMSFRLIFLERVHVFGDSAFKQALLHEWTCS